MRPLGEEGGGWWSPSAFTISLAPQRNKMSEACPGCQEAGTLERVSWKYVSGVGNPEELLPGTRKGQEGESVHEGLGEAGGHRL